MSSKTLRPCSQPLKTRTQKLPRSKAVEESAGKLTALAEQQRFQLVNEEKIADLKKETQSAMDKERSLATTIAQLTQRNAQASRALSSVKDELANLTKSSGETARAQSSELKITKVALSELRGKYTEATNSVKTLRLELAAITDKHGKLLSTSKDINEEVVWLRSEREKALIESKSLKGLQKKIATDSAAIKQSLETEILKLEEENEGLSEEIKTLKGSAKDYAKSIAQFEREKLSLTREMEVLQLANAEKDSPLKKLQEEFTATHRTQTNRQSTPPKSRAVCAGNQQTGS